MPDLHRMLEARSVAVVGASSRPGSVGEQMMRQLLGGGFEGEVYPVNPNYEEVLGIPCLPSLAEVPRGVDLALLGVANERLEEQLRMAGEAGVGAVVIFASGYEDAPGDPPLLERWRSIVDESEIAVCGGNCMGFINVERRLRAVAFAEREDLEPGPIAFLSHSGSVFSALLRNDRGLRFNLAVSAGQELTTTVSDYLLYALDLPSTRVAALFIETVRDPERFREGLARAEERDVPVVVLKVGRESATRDLIEAHSGALAGDDGAYEAVFEAHGALRVETLDEMADALELLVSGRRAAPGGLAAIHDSGGERAHLIDRAAAAGVRFAEISDTTKDRLTELLDPGLPAVNPLDAWGTGHDYEELYHACMHALLADPDTGALAFVVDLAGDDLEPGYARVAERVWGETDLPLAVLCNMASAIGPESAEQLRAAGVPVLEGTDTGLAAFRLLFELRDHRELPQLQPPAPPSEDGRERWRARLGSGEPWTEAEGLRLLSDYGLPVVEFREATTEEEAVAAARELGFPVVLKTAAPGVGHKSDRGGVRLGLRSEDEARAAYLDLSQRLGSEVVVARQAPEGVELALGVVRDDQFGPLVLVAAGGVLVEVLDDRRLALPPLDAARARRLVDGLAARSLLDGLRGRPPVELDAVVEALVRLSRLASDLGDALDALDVNPLIAGPGGCVAADALVIPRRDAGTP